MSGGALVKRDYLFLHCEAGHEWALVGGRACGCEGSLGYCSLPVYRCAKCGDYDYGDNDEARQIVTECDRRGEDEVTA